MLGRGARGDLGRGTACVTCVGDTRDEEASDPRCVLCFDVVLKAALATANSEEEVETLRRLDGVPLRLLRRTGRGKCSYADSRVFPVEAGATMVLWYGTILWYGIQKQTTATAINQ